MKEERTKRNQKLLKVATSGCISLKPCRVGREEMLGTGYVSCLTGRWHLLHSIQTITPYACTASLGRAATAHSTGPCPVHLLIFVLL
jgi:hypothetical protein